MVQCAILKQWPLRTAVEIALNEGNRYAGYMGYPCWSASTSALLLAAWAVVYEASMNPTSSTAMDLNKLANNLLSKLPEDKFDPSSLLTMNQRSTLDVAYKVESN